nr:hypothetical protein [Tanacetum cinerariifolium]
MDSNKSIHRSDEQRNLYKALVEAHESDKIILDTYGDIVTLKRRRDDDADKDEEPSTRSDRGTTGNSTQGSKSQQKTASEFAPIEEPMQTTQDLEEPSYQEFETSVADDQPIAEASQHPECDLAKQADSRSSFNELIDTPVDFSAFLINRRKVDTLTLEWLAGPTYELMKGSCKSLVELEFFLEEVYKATTDYNKSIHRSDEQRNLYKALVEAHESDKIILDTYGDIVTLKRRRDDDADKDEEPSTRSDRGTTGNSTQGSKSQQKTASEFAPIEEPMQTTQDLEEPSYQEFETSVADDQPIAEASQHPECDLAKQADSRSSFNELIDTPVDFSAFLINRRKVDTLTLEWLAGPTYELMKGSCKSLVELEFFLEEVYKATTD